MAAITAKITCNSKVSYGDGDDRLSTLGFCPDYQDGRNAAWAASTPHLDLRMTVRGDVGDQFEMGRSYTLTFEPEN